MDATTEADLRALAADIARQHHCDHRNILIKPTTSNGANYTTSLYLITLTSDDGKLELFAKVATIGEELRKTIRADRLFTTEEFVYNKLMKTYNKLQDDHDISRERRLTFAKFYGCNNEKLRETIVLENLVALGYTTVNRIESVQLDYALAAMETIAKWHALSIAFEVEYPEEFSKVCDKVPFTLPHESADGKSQHQQFCWGALKIVKEESRDKLVTFLSNFNKDIYAKCYQGNGRKVLSHGDYRPSNLMHKIVNGNYEVIPVDFQMVHTGCVSADIYYFIFTGTDRAFRSKYMSRLINHYYQYLGDTLKCYDLDVSKEYPRIDFDRDMAKGRIFGIVIALFFLPVVTVDEDLAPKMGGEAKISDFALAPNKVYAERFNGIIDDFIEWELI